MKQVQHTGKAGSTRHGGHAGSSRLRHEDCKLGANRSYIVRTYKKQTKQMKRQDGGQLASSITQYCKNNHAIN